MTVTIKFERPSWRHNVRSISYERNIKNLVETTTLPEDSYLDQDAEILEIFVEEIEEIFVELNALFPEWLSDPAHQENLKTIRRHFHTLKGSGRMVGLNLRVKLLGQWKIP